MSLLSHAWKLYKEEGAIELLKRSTSYIRDRGLGWFLAHLISETSLGVRFKNVISRSTLLTALYFYVRRTFKHEQQAILRGHKKYYQNERQQEEPKHRIIRHTHMLEKGISMRDRREVFGVEVANDLVDNVIQRWDQKENGNSDDQLRWSIDVLNEYFQVVASDPMLSHSRKRFNEFIKSNDIEIGDRTPKPRHSLESHPVNYEQLLDLAQQRSSTRWFQEKEVDREKIDEAIRIAAESPSACNRQSFEYRVYDDPNVLDDILQPPLGITGYKENIPCLVVLVGKQRAYFRESEKNVPFIDASLSAMAFQFALETLDLASCTINWPAVYSEHKRMDQIIGLDEDEVVITLMAVGYPDPDGKVPYSHKKSLDDLRSYNRT